MADQNPLTTLGERLRQARLARGMSQENLAQPEFTKSYVSAVERGKARPSLKALELMARRLSVPLSDFLTLKPAEADAVDVAALEEDFAYQLDHAKLLITTERGDDALDLIRTAEQAVDPHFAEFSPLTRYRFYRLRALAYLRLNAPGLAREDLDHALSLAQHLDDPQEIERARNALGVVFYDQDMPGQALEQHRACEQAIRQGVVKDLTLRLNILRNLANDYWALKDSRRAITTYQEALALLEDVGTLEQQAGVYWGLSLVYKDGGDLVRAKLYARQALTIYEAAANQVAIAGISINLAELFLAQQEFAVAEDLLARAEQQLTSPRDDLLLSTVYAHYTQLYLQRGDDSAAAAAQRSVDLSRSVYEQHARQGDLRAQANIVRTYAQALSVAGQVAERQGRTAEADTLFQQALALVNQTEYAETSYEIIFTYADLLGARGDHQQAAQYYRMAAQWRVPRSAAR
jgi:transcriptional regulator with XRE-family HTH domain